VCRCDCYIVKDILQNWSDGDATLILDNLFKIVGKGNRILVMETIMHTGLFAEERVSLRIVWFGINLLVVFLI